MITQCPFTIMLFYATVIIYFVGFIKDLVSQERNNNNSSDKNNRVHGDMILIATSSNSEH